MNWIIPTILLASTLSWDVPVEPKPVVAFEELETKRARGHFQELVSYICFDKKFSRPQCWAYNRDIQALITQRAKLYCVTIPPLTLEAHKCYNEAIKHIIYNETESVVEEWFTEKL